MPSVSKKQHNLMAMVAHNPEKAKQLGIKQSVGEHFLTADKGKKFSKGGSMKEDKAMELRHVAAMKKAGVPKKIVKEEQAEAAAMCKGGKAMAKMRKGGYVSAADGITKKGKTKGRIC